jgi:hypothetical protein
MCMPKVYFILFSKIYSPNILDLNRILGYEIQLKSIYNYTHKIKEIIEYFTTNYIPIITLSGDVEIDEVFIQGRKRYDNWNNAKCTNIVFGIICRETKEFVLVSIPNKSGNSIYPILNKYIEPGSRIYSDKMVTYVNPKWQFTSRAIWVRTHMDEPSSLLCGSIRFINPF